MSRCFPFPPPGYEKKARPDNVELFKEAKHRETKHKKKDKDKQGSKEKGEKDRSERKHRERKEKREKHKDKKEKHRDKKKDKDTDKDKDKEKSSISVEKRASEGNVAEKLHEKEERHKSKSSISDEKGLALLFRGHNGKEPVQNSLQARDTDNFKFVLELDRRIREEQKGASSQLDERSLGTDWKRKEGTNKYVGGGTGIPDEIKQQHKDKRVEDKSMGLQRISGEARSEGNSLVQNIAGMVQKKVEAAPQPIQKNVEGKMDGKEKEKSKDREVGDKQRGKHKDKDRDRKNNGKDDDRDKEKKKERSEHKKTEVDKSKDTKKNNFVGFANDKSSHLLEDCYTSVKTEGDQKKRKAIETNGFLHDNEARPGKMPRLPSPFKDNGQQMEACQTPGMSTSAGPVGPNNISVDKKEQKLNGFREPQLSSSPKVKPWSSVTCAELIAEAPSKPPHPDSEYLSQILSIPKMVEWSDFDDQGWLFSSRDSPPQKPEAGSVGANEEPRVWAGALRIESADVFALPYVIPY